MQLYRRSLQAEVQKQGERAGEAGVQAGVQNGPELLQARLPQVRRVNGCTFKCFVRVTEPETLVEQRICV